MLQTKPKCYISQNSVVYYVLLLKRGCLLNQMVFGGIEGSFCSLKSIVLLYFYGK